MPRTSQCCAGLGSVTGPSQALKSPNALVESGGHNFSAGHKKQNHILACLLMLMSNTEKNLKNSKHGNFKTNIFNIWSWIQTQLISLIRNWSHVRPSSSHSNGMHHGSRAFQGLWRACDRVEPCTTLPPCHRHLRTAIYTCRRNLRPPIVVEALITHPLTVYTIQIVFTCDKLGCKVIA